MINLLPPDVKEQQRYARHNTTLLRYMLLIFLVAGVMSLLVLGGKYYADQQLKALENEYDKRQSRMQEFGQAQEKAKDINSQLKLTETLIAQQSYYSNFVNELAEATPSWAQITQLNLARLSSSERSNATSTELRVDINFEFTSLDRVSDLQREIQAMERVDFVDIQNASRGENGRATATLALGLNTPPHQKLPVAEEDQP